MAKGRNQGSQSRNVTERPVRVGARSDNVNVRAVSQVGQSLGNKAGTDLGRKVNPVEATYKGRAPAGGPGGVKLGNEIATQGLGVGGGRRLYGQSGSQQTYGKPVAGLPRIDDTRAEWPDTNNKR
jgi:hypothetical protein